MPVRKSRYLIAETLPLMLLLPPLLARGHLVLLITCHSTRVINDFALSSRAPSYLVPRHLPLLFCHCYYFAADPFLSFSLARKIVQSMTRKMNIRRGNEKKFVPAAAKSNVSSFRFAHEEVRIYLSFNNDDCIDKDYSRFTGKIANAKRKV